MLIFLFETEIEKENYTRADLVLIKYSMNSIDNKNNIPVN